MEDVVEMGRRRHAMIDLTRDDVVVERPVAPRRLLGAEPPVRRQAVIDLTGDDDDDVVVIMPPNNNNNNNHNNNNGRFFMFPPPALDEGLGGRRANEFLARAQVQEALEVLRLRHQVYIYIYIFFFPLFLSLFVSFFLSFLDSRAGASPQHYSFAATARSPKTSGSSSKSDDVSCSKKTY
jgi:hypothetical protein